MEERRQDGQRGEEQYKGAEIPEMGVTLLVAPIEGVKTAYVYALRDNFVSHVRRLVETMTYSQIAKMLGTHAPRISEWLNGQSVPTWDMVIENYDKVLTWGFDSKRERKAKKGRE